MGTFIYYDSIDDYEEQFKKAMLYDALNEEQQTRKHWQDVAADHCLNEKLYEFKINEAIDYIWNFDVNFYSDNPELVNTKMLEVKSLLQENGFIINGKGYDVASDEPTHTGRGMNVLKIEK